MNTTQARTDQLSHAQWRVRFLKSLLKVHRSIPQWTSYDWLLQEADYLQRIAQAERELVARGGMHS
jgi:uncharacterized protein HemX